jgi:catechol 2,3-dioxygenase-like lactoylglutathione lyase family enzyme
MAKFITSVREIEPRQVSRRHVLISLLAAGLWRPHAAIAELQSKPQGSQLPVRVSTLNHVSFGCADLRSSVRWYGRIFGMAVHAFQDYRGGQTVLRIGNGPAYVALSQLDAKSIGKPPARLPHFCWGVEDFNLDRILRALSEVQAPAQAVLREGKTINGVKFDDPDGFPLQFNPASACGGGGFLGDVCDASAKADRPPGDPPLIPARTLNHVRLIVPNIRRSLEWYLKLTDMKLQTYQEPGGGPILRVGTGPQFVALVEGSGPAAFRPHVGFGVQGFDPDQIVKRLAEHGVTARTRLREDATVEVLIDTPDGIEIQLQDISYCGGRGRLGNICA